MTRFSKTWLALFLVGALLTPVVYYLGPYPTLAKAMAPDSPFDEKPAASLAAATSRFAALNKPTRELYRRHLVQDIGFFLSLGLASASLLMLAWGPHRKRSTMALVLFFTTAFVIMDGTENAILWTWFSGTRPSETSVRLLRLATHCKFAALLLTVPVFVWGLILRLLPNREPV